MNKKVESGYVCSGKDCSRNGARAKGFLAILSSSASCESASASLSTSMPEQSLLLSSASPHLFITWINYMLSYFCSFIHIIICTLYLLHIHIFPHLPHLQILLFKGIPVLLAKKVRKLPYEIPRASLRHSGKGLLLPARSFWRIGSGFSPFG